jgi:hypothetical protein
MATLGGGTPSPDDWMARLGQGLGNNQMALLGLAGGLLGGQGFAGGFDRMAAGSKVDQSRQYLARELADKKKKEEALAARKAALIRAYGPDAVEQMGIEGAGDMAQALELAKRKPKAPEDRYESIIDQKSGIEYQINQRTGEKSILNKPAREDRFESSTDPKSGIEYQTNVRTGERSVLNKPAGDRLQTADKKMLWDSEDKLINLDATLSNLDRAAALAPKAKAGYFPISRAQVGAGLFNDQESKDTLELNQLLSPEAIKTMAETLSGATTNFELQKFEEVLADPSSPPDLKLKTIARMRSLAERQKDLLTSRAAEIRGGTPGRGPQGASQAGGNLPRVSSPEEAMKLPPGTRFIDPNGVERVRP